MAEETFGMRLSELEKARDLFGSRLQRLEQEETLKERRMSAVESNSVDHARIHTETAKRINSLIDEVADLTEAEIKRSTDEKHAQEYRARMEEAIREMRADFKNGIASIQANVDKRFDGLAGYGKWILFAFGGALVTAISNFVLSGRLLP